MPKLIVTTREGETSEIDVADGLTDRGADNIADQVAHRIANGFADIEADRVPDNVADRSADDVADGHGGLGGRRGPGAHGLSDGRPGICRRRETL